MSGPETLAPASFVPAAMYCLGTGSPYILRFDARQRLWLPRKGNWND